ncbi:MAG: oligosaccharide flippase family protein [Phycisphaerales bacterium]|nr:oligosaccharide flippase family protein [Phycisphaerales bacterium]
MKRLMATERVSGRGLEAPSGAARMSRDVRWNLGSLAIVGIGGILLNLLIADQYGEAALGVFNQVFAAYIFFSQFAAGGVHLSALRAVAQAHSDAGRRVAVSAAVALTAFLSILFTAGFYFSRVPIAWALASPDVATGMAWASLGLFCFAVNKTLFGVINGRRQMRLYAVAQALRTVLMLATLLVLIYIGAASERVPVVFTIAEIAIFVILTIATAGDSAAKWDGRWRVWIRRHFRFGVRSAGSGIMLELNTRVDVLMLGLMKSDAVVGLYSFAAMLVEGIAQLPIVARTNVNPLLAKHLKTRDLAALAPIVSKTRKLTFLAMLAVGVIAVAAYPIGVRLVTNREVFFDSWPIFAILMGGLVASAAWIPLNQILLQGGRPATHTVMSLIIVIANIAMNAALIPAFGAIGAAFATAAAFLISAVLVRWLAWQCLEVRV